MRNIKSLMNFRLRHFFKKLKKISFPLLIALLLLSDIYFFGKQSGALKPVVVLSNEDSSMIGKLLVGTILKDDLKSVMDLRELPLKEGRELLQKGKAECLLHIRKGTVETLYEGKLTGLDYYVRDAENDFSQFLGSFIRGFIDIINTSQNAGLLYMDVLHEGGMTWEEREKVFTELQTAYVSKALARGRIFEEKGGIIGAIKGKGFFFMSLFIFLLFDFFFLKLGIWRRKPMMERFALAGYKKSEMFLSELCCFVLLNGFLTGLLFLVNTIRR